MDIWSAYYKGSFECEFIEYEKASISSVRCKVEHVFRIIKCQLGYRKVACRGLKKTWLSPAPFVLEKCLP